MLRRVGKFWGPKLKMAGGKPRVKLTPLRWWIIMANEFVPDISDNNICTNNKENRSHPLNVYSVDVGLYIYVYIKKDFKT